MLTESLRHGIYHMASAIWRANRFR